MTDMAGVSTRVFVIFFAAMLLLVNSGNAQEAPLKGRDAELYGLAQKDIGQFARQLTKGETSELAEAQRIVRWLATNFEWKFTDYQKRTVQQIVDRRGGNCDELAAVALAAMQALGIRLRRVHEINIYTNSPERGSDSDAMIKDKGLAYSVFGRHHNDHVWLELYDSRANEWFPADPSSGLVGNFEWLKGRVWFGKRATLNPLTNDMIVPFAIFAADEKGEFTIDRTRHYLVDEFDRLYGGRLSKIPVWRDWVAGLEFLDPKAAAALSGTLNLHDYETRIDALADTYEQLRRASMH